MSEAGGVFLQNLEKESQGRFQALERLLHAADTSKVFGQPVVSGQYTVITAADIASGGGFGSGMGFGLPRTRPVEVADQQVQPAERPAEGAGGGGGGGGGSMGRPVATIVIGPDGVEVKPVLDVTKISLTALAVFAGLVALCSKMLKKR